MNPFGQLNIKHGQSAKMSEELDTVEHQTVSISSYSQEQGKTGSHNKSHSSTLALSMI